MQQGENATQAGNRQRGRSKGGKSHILTRLTRWEMASRSAGPATIRPLPVRSRLLGRSSRSDMIGRGGASCAASILEVRSILT